MKSDKTIRITYRDGLSDGRVQVKVNGKIVGFYVNPKKKGAIGINPATYYFFYEQGKSMKEFLIHYQIEDFVRENLV